MAIAAILDVNNKVVDRIVVRFIDDIPGAVDGSSCGIGDLYDPIAKTFSVPADKAAKLAADETEFQRVSALITAIKNDAALNALKNMTPAQIDTYFTNNITDLPSVINLLKRLVKLLARNL